MTTRKVYSQFSEQLLHTRVRLCSWHHSDCLVWPDVSRSCQA